TAVLACRKVAEIVVGGEPGSLSSVSSGEYRAARARRRIAGVDEGIVVDQPVVGHAVGGRGDDPIADSRAAVRVVLVPHEDVAVDFHAIRRPGAHRYNEAGTFDVLENVVADVCPTVRVDGARIIAVLVSEAFGVMISAAGVARNHVVLNGCVDRATVVLKWCVAGVVAVAVFL